MNQKNIAVVLSANATSFKTQMAMASGAVNDFDKQVSGSSGGVSKWATAVKVATAAVALAVLAVAATSVKMAADFDRSMRNVNSISKLPEAAFKDLSKQVLQLSTKLPQSAKELADGLYDIASSGFQGAAGVKVLEASARAASAGLSDTKTAAQAIVAVLNAYGLSADNAAQVSDVLFQTVNVGVVSFGELAGSLGDVVGLGAAAHVSINELGAAVAAMTLAGIPAAEATTSLNRTIQALIQPSDALTNVLQSLGYQSGAQALQVDGLHGVMEKLRTVTGGNVEALMALFPEIRAARGAFALMAADGKNYATTFDAIGNSTNVAGATQAAFEEQMKAVSAQWDIFINKIQAGAITLGTALLPAVSQGMQDLEDFGAAAVEFGQNAAAKLQPFFDGVAKGAKNVADLIKQLAREFGPLARALATIGGAAVVGTLNAIGTVIEKVTGFLDKNRAIVEVVAALYAVKLAVAVGQIAVRAFETLALKAMYAGDTLAKLGPSLSGLGIMGGVAITAMATLQWGFNNAADRARKAEEATNNFTQALQANSQQALNDAMFKNIQDSGVLDYVDKLAGGVANMASEVRSATPEFTNFSAAVLGAGANDLAAFNRALDGFRGASDPFVQQLIAAHDAGTLTNGELQSLIRNTQNLGRELEAAKVKVQATKDIQAQLGQSTDTTSGAMSQQAGVAGDLAQRMQSVADATKAADDAYRASVDPLFAMNNALIGNIKANADLTKTEQSGTASAEDIADAHAKAAQSALDVESAAIKLEGAIRSGAVTLDTSKLMLAEWVQQGLITQETADKMGQKFDEAAWKAAQLQGTNITITMSADDRAFQETLRHIQDLANKGIQVNVPIGGRVLQRWGGIMEFAGGGVTPAHITNKQVIKYGEPATGGEAFIPRRGNDIRSKKILDVAASWYGMQVTPMASGGIVDSAISGVQQHSATVASGRDVLRGSAVGNNIMASALAANDGDLSKAANQIETDLNRVAEAYANVAEVAGQAAADQLASANLTADEFAQASSDIIQQTQAEGKALKKTAQEEAQAEKERAAAHMAANDVRFQVGDLGTPEYLAILQKRLSATEKYSQEWKQVWDQIQSINAQVAAEHMTANDTKYAIGDLDTASYLTILQKRLAATKQYSSEWKQIWDQIQSINNSVAADHMKMHDIQFAVGDMNADDYRAILQKRLDATEKYSEDWYAVWQQIQDFDKKKADDQKALDDRMYSHGLISNKDYLKILNDRLAGTKQYSAEWFDIVDQIEKTQQSIIDDTTTTVDELSKKIEDLTGTLFGAYDASTQFYNSLQSLVDTAAKGGDTFDVLTAAGRANRSALSQAAQSAISDAKAVYANTGDLTAAAQALQHDIDSITASLQAEGVDPTAILRQLGLGGTDLSSVIAGMPGGLPTAAPTTADIAQAAAQGVKDATNNYLGDIGVIKQLLGRGGGGALDPIASDISAIRQALSSPQSVTVQIPIQDPQSLADPKIRKMVEAVAITTARNVARGLKN